MKKLMVALTAVALGACAWAEEAVTPTLTGKVEFKNEAAGSWTRGTDWAYSGNDAAEALKIVGNEGSRVLEIKTGTAVLTRNVKQGGGATNICEGIYIDTVIDFQNQALDEVPTATNDEKIAIFVLDTTEIEGAPAGTNVYVMAGYGPTGKALYRLYGFDDIISSGQRRVVVKSYADVIEGDEPRTGFLVYIQNVVEETFTPCKVDLNGVYEIGADGAVTWTNVGTTSDYLGLTAEFKTTAAVARWVNTLKNSACLFLSMPTSKNTKQGNLSAVDFVGNAQIASVEVTATNPGFPADLFTMTLAATGVTVELVSGEDVNLAGNVLTATANNVPVEVRVTLDKGMDVVTASGATKLDNGNWSFTFANGGTVSFTGSKAAAYVDETAYPTIEAAIAEANANGGTLKLAQPTTWPKTDSAIGDNANVTLDLAGQTLTFPEGGTLENYGTLTIVDTTGGGRIVGRIVDNGSRPAVDNYGTLTINAGIFDGEVYNESAVTVNGGWFHKDYNSTEDVPPAFTLVDSVADGLEAVLDPEDNYWKVQTKAAASVALTINATGATISGVEEGTVTEGSNITFTVTAAADYKNPTVKVTGAEVKSADGSYSFTVGTEPITITVTATKITWATLTITSVDNCTIAVSNGNVAVASGAKFDVDANVKLTVTRTPADGYELDGCAASETITMTESRTVTAAVKVSSGTTYPIYIPADASAETKAKFDAWVTAKASGDRDASGANMEAFLLNVAPDAAATEKSNFKVTAITVNADGTVTVTTTTENSAGDAYNGTVKVKGKVNLTDADWVEKDATHKFFKAFLVVE